MIILQSAPGFDFSTLIFMLGIFVVFYFFFIRPQSKKAKEQREFISKLEKGDKVITAGGIHGKIVKVDDDSVLLEVDANTKIRVEKSVISLDFSKDKTNSKVDAK